MNRATQLLKKRQAEMAVEYGIYHTDWAEDWPNFYQITFARNLFRERIKNKYQIFLLFYPMIGIILSAVIAIIFGIILKSWGAIWIFVLLAVIVIIAYSAYFAILSSRIKKLNGIIGHYYTKYGREILKNLYKRYRPDELPPEPERYYDLEDGWFTEKDFQEEAAKVPRRKRSKDQEEEKHESEQVVMDKNQNDELEPTDDLAAEARAFRRRKEEDLQKEGGSDHVEEKSATASGIDLHLVGDDGKINSDSSASVVIDNNSSSGSPEENSKSDSSRESGETLSTQTEDGGEPETNEVEAVRVIDAEPIRKESDAEDNQQAEGEDNTSQEEERQNEFPSIIDGEEVSSDSEVVVNDPFVEIDYDDYEEDDDYAEGNDDTEGSFEEESEDETEDDESEEEESEDETEDDESEDDEPEEPEDESDEEESGEELDEEEPVDEEDGDGPLFPEGYLPTVDELLAALQTLSNS